MNHKRIPFISISLFIPLLAGWLLTAVFSSSHAAPRAVVEVNSLVDEADGSCTDGDCSLRDAITTATSGDTITFNITGTIVLSSAPHFLGELAIDKDLTINGGQAITISGNNASRVFNVLTSTLSTQVAVTFDSLTIISGSVTTTDCGVFTVLCGGGIILQNSGVAVTVANSTLSGNSAASGGGISNRNGTVTLNNSTLSGNSATSVNSATFGGGIDNVDGTVTLGNSTLSGNSAGSAGGGIFTYNGTVTLNNSTLSGNSATDGGGIDNYYGTVTLSNSTISGNSADYGGGGGNFWGKVTLSNSTISGNSANQKGGGIYSDTAGGDCAALAATIINNSTISGNSAAFGGGIHNENGVTEISHSTISTNTAATAGAGVWSSNNGAACTRMGNSIVAGNLGGGDVAAYDEDAPIQRFSSLGHNLVGTAGANVDFSQEFTATGDMTDTLPLLGPLANNGGDTLTHMPLAGSPAIDAGSCSSGPTTDQRGALRPQDATCDIGAVESNPLFGVFLPVVIK